MNDELELEKAARRDVAMRLGCTEIIYMRLVLAVNDFFNATFPYNHSAQEWADLVKMHNDLWVENEELKKMIANVGAAGHKQIKGKTFSLFGWRLVIGYTKEAPK